MEPEFVILVLWNAALSAHIVLSWYIKKRKAKKFRSIWLDDEAGHMPSPTNRKWPVTKDESFPGLDDSLAKRMPDYKRKKQAFDKHIDHKF